MRTTRDWIKQAASAGACVASCLVEAAAVVRFPSDWNDIAEAWLAHGDRPDQTAGGEGPEGVASGTGGPPGETARGAAARCVAAAMAAADGDLSTCRQAAALLAGPLGDRGGAVAALASAEATLRASERAQCDRWVWLAEAHRRLLGDEDAVVRCVAEATQRARSAADLCDLADGKLTLDGDREAGHALLEAAEAAARRDADFRVLWKIANRWNHEPLCDPARARAALELGTREAHDVTTLAALATAWCSVFRDEAGIAAALGRGEALATTTAEWLKLAEGYRDGGDGARGEAWSPAGVRRCLVAAAATPATAAERSAIARGFRLWLHDRAAADDIAPAGVAPEDVIPAAWPLAGWDRREPRALLHWLRTRISDQALRGIATADYGSGWIKHHQVVVEIARSGLVPMPLEWYPLEALELTRWRAGDTTDHVQRAFAAVLLAFDQAGPACEQVGEIQDSLAPLLESCWILGVEAELELFLVWLCEVLDVETNQAWALLALVLSLARRAPDDARLPALVERLERAVGGMHPYGGDPVWLYGTTNFTQSRALWRAMVAEVLAPDRALGPELLRLAARLASA
jgi:hypothetical protein